MTLKPTAAPSLSVSTTSSTSGTFKLSWTRVVGATRYTLHQTVSGQLTTPYNASGTTWPSKALGNGSYIYRIFACNAAGCGPGSTIKTVSVLHIPPKPSSVSVLDRLPYPGNPWTISWTAASGASRYTLRRTNTGSQQVITTNEGNTTHTTDYTVPGTYQYAVQACNASGCSGWRNAGNTTVVFCAEGPAVATPGQVHPDILKCGGTPLATPDSATAGGTP